MICKIKYNFADEVLRNEVKYGFIAIAKEAVNNAVKAQ